MTARAGSAKALAPAAPPVGLEALRHREAQLESQWARLQRSGFGYRGVLGALSDPGLSPEERRRRLAAADEAQADFLGELNGFSRALHRHFMAQVTGELDHALETMESFYGKRRLRGTRLRHWRLRRLADRYHELEDQFGSAGDHRRIAIYQRFYAGVIAFSRRVRRLDPTLPGPRPASWVERLYALRRALGWLFTSLGTTARLAGAFFGILRTLLSRRTGTGGTPFTRQVDALFRALGRLRGHEVIVSGAERVPRTTEGDVVNLFTPAHRHGVTDNIAFSHLALPDYLVFNAVDQLPLLPRPLVERVARTDGLIAVGRGRGPSVDRALDALARGLSRNILIYPEGSVSEGFRGTRPPRPNFGGGLVPRIREAGHRVRILPVTYLDNARFLDLPPRSATPEERRLRVTVTSPLEPTMVDALLAAGGGEMVNRMVRLAWLESLVTDERHFLGQDRVREIERRLDFELLDGLRYWGSVDPLPVADRLETLPPVPIEVRDEPFRGKRVRVFHVPESARRPDGTIPLRNLRDPETTELLIGIRAPSHIYLNVGPQRFDGDIFRRLKVKQRDAVYPGILIRFMGVPVRSLNAIRRELERFSGRETRTLTCAHSACKVIARAANIEIDDHADMRPFLPSHVLPTRTIRKLIERGVRDHAGRPVEVQIYNTDGRPLETVLAEMRRAELRIAGDHLRMRTFGRQPREERAG